MDSESERSFEIEVANLLRAAIDGAEVAVNDAIDGLEIDIVVRRGKRRGQRTTVIECKASGSPIGNVAVAAFGSVFQYLREAGEAEEGWIVSSAGFTPAALAEAEKFDLSLFTLGDLRQRYSVQERDFRPSATQVQAESGRTAHGKKRIFVIMPFAPEMADVFILGIRWVAARLGVVAQRSDDIQHNGDIITEIQRAIRDYDGVVGDTTGANANVCYEVGYAHALNRPTVLICRQGEALPFDLRGVNHVMYPNVVELRKLLRPRLKAALRI